MTIGDIIKSYRAEHHISQDIIANRAGVSKAYISILERNVNPKTGQPPVASLKTINSIAKAIGSDFDSIFDQLDDDIKIAVGEQIPVRNGLKIKDKIKKRIPDYEASLKDISIDSWTYATLILFAQKNNRTLQEEIEDRLYQSLESDIDDMVCAEDHTIQFEMAARNGEGCTIKTSKENVDAAAKERQRLLEDDDQPDL